MFKNRDDAGRQLAERLRSYAGQPGVVLAVPRGGVPVAFPVARALHWPLDLIMTKKIGHPNNAEYAIGAVSPDDRVITPHDDVPASYIEEETVRLRARLQQLYTDLMGNRPPVSIENKTVMVVDDGIATGMTLLSIVGMLRRRHPARIVIAAPVAPPEAVELLAGAVDEVVVLECPDDFYSVGRYYDDFTQVDETEVRRLLTRVSGAAQ